MKKFLILALSFLCCGASAQQDVQVVNLKGLEAALTKYRGQAVLVDFWAIWCEPCVAELPELVEVAREFRTKGGIVVGVSYDFMIPGVSRDEAVKQVRAFVTARKIDIPTFIYEAPDYDAINDRFGLPGPIPYTLAIDRNGKIVDRQQAKAGKARFAAMLQKALAR